MTTARPVVYEAAKPMYVTPEAFAQHFAISKMAAYRLCHCGALKWIRVGRSMRIPVAELARYANTAEGHAYTEVWGQA